MQVYIDQSHAKQIPKFTGVSISHPMEFFHKYVSDNKYRITCCLLGILADYLYV